MFNTLIMSLKIDYTYSINAFIYNLRRLPILKDLITEDIYKSKNLKRFISIISIIYSCLKTIFFHLLYFFLIYFLASIINKTNISKSFIHIYFIFSIIGFFINNNLLNTSKKKYFSIVLFNMNAKKFMESSLFYNLFRYLILNILSFMVISYFIDIPFIIIIYLLLIPFFLRIVGEALNILFYKKYSYVWINNYYLYFSILISLLVVSFLPFKDIFVSRSILFIFLIGGIILSLISLTYLLRVKDYKIMFKKLNTKNAVLSKDNSYNRQKMVEVKKKDIKIDSRKLKNKKGYDLFNTIFFERHKEILMRSSKKYSLVLMGIYIILLILGRKVNILNNLGAFIILMYFINRGAIVTQAMFFNCDHAMLRYNFYRERSVLLNLFKKRLTTLIRVNLLPALVIILGNSLLLLVNGNNNIFIYLMLGLYIISLSIFFSIHYLVIYYLLQPFDSSMQIRKISYSIVSILTYVACYFLIDVNLNYLYFSLFSIIFTIVYSVISLYLVYRFSPETFKIN